MIIIAKEKNRKINNDKRTHNEKRKTTIKKKQIK